MMSDVPVAEKRTREEWLTLLAAHDKGGSVAGLTLAQRAAAAFPDDAAFLAEQGRQQLLLEQFADAETSLWKALELAPDHAGIMLHLAQLFVVQGRYEEAVGKIEAALAAGRSGKSGLWRAGLLLHEMGHHVEAARLIAQGIAISSNATLFLRHDEALSGIAEDADAGARPCDKAPLRRAQELLRKGEPGQAEPLFAELTRDRPAFAHGWIGLRGALEAQGRITDAQALGRAWASASPGDAAAIEIGTRRKLGGRGFVFDPRDHAPVRAIAQSTRRVASGADLLEGEDACLVIDPGGQPVVHNPIVSLDGLGEDLATLRYRTSPKYVTGLRNAALVGEGLVFNARGELIEELIPPTKPPKFGAARAGDRMSFDPNRFRDGMGEFRFHDRPALLMAGITDTSFGDWIINFPPRLAFAEAAGLGNLPVVVRSSPQPYALDILRALGVGPERVIFHEPQRISLFSRLIAPSWPTPDRMAPTAGVYDVYRRARLPASGSERTLLYLTRRNVRSRQMVNEDEVCDLFERRGFRIIDPGSLPFDDVRALFANPACVAGPFGSAFHNLAFSNSRPVNLALISNHSRFQLDEITLWHGDLGLRFGYLWGESAQDLPAGGYRRLVPWVAPMDRLDRAIDAILELALDPAH